MKRFTTRADPAAVRAPDLVKRDFTADRPDRLWVADFTYCSTWSGVVYLAFISDVYSRRIVGWKAARTMHTALVLDALNMAAWTRRATSLTGLICHNDAGSQYTSIAYTDRVAELDAAPSIGTIGDSFDCDDGGVGVPAGLTLAMTDRRVLALTCRPAGAPTSVAC